MTLLRTSSRSHPRGFSLIEILVVLCVTGALAGLTVMAAGSLRQAGDISRSGHEIADILQQARSYAMANNTMTWVGFAPQPEQKLTVGVAAARHYGAPPTVTDGSSSDSDIIPLGRLRTYDNLELITAPDSTARPVVESGGQLAEGESPVQSFSLRQASRTVNFDTFVIQFDSRGQARIAQGAVKRLIEIGLTSTSRGNDGIKNYAAIQVTGLAGNVSVHRP